MPNIIKFLGYDPVPPPGSLAQPASYAAEKAVGLSQKEAAPASWCGPRYACAVGSAASGKPTGAFPGGV